MGSDVVSGVMNGIDGVGNGVMNSNGRMWSWMMKEQYPLDLNIMFLFVSPCPRGFYLRGKLRVFTPVSFPYPMFFHPQNEMVPGFRDQQNVLLPCPNIPYVRCLNRRI